MVMTVCSSWCLRLNYLLSSRFHKAIGMQIISRTVQGRVDSAP